MTSHPKVSCSMRKAALWRLASLEGVTEGDLGGRLGLYKTFTTKRGVYIRCSPIAVVLRVSPSPMRNDMILQSKVLCGQSTIEVLLQGVFFDWSYEKF